MKIIKRYSSGHAMDVREAVQDATIHRDDDYGPRTGALECVESEIGMLRELVARLVEVMHTNRTLSNDEVMTVLGGYDYEAVP